MELHFNKCNLGPFEYHVSAKWQFAYSESC